MNSIIEEFRICLRKYADFTGRASRKEFWSFLAVHFIIIAILTILFSIMLELNSDLDSFEKNVIIGIIGLYTLAMLLPTWSVGARRLHDTGRSGWLQLLNFVPGGALVVLIFYAWPGEIDSNEYGQNPLSNPEVDEEDMSAHLIE